MFLELVGTNVNLVALVAAMPLLEVDHLLVDPQAAR